MTAKIMNPIVTLNGTSRQALVEQRISAMRAVRSVMERLGEMAPHGRDYIGESERYNEDRTIHRARIAVLDSLHNEIEEEALAIQG